jgi:hypothetical protein
MSALAAVVLFVSLTPIVILGILTVVGFWQEEAIAQQIGH